MLFLGSSSAAYENVNRGVGGDDRDLPQVPAPRRMQRHSAEVTHVQRASLLQGQQGRKLPLQPLKAASPVSAKFESGELRLLHF